MTIDISNFNINIPMTHYEYLKLKLCDIPDEIITMYNLREKAKPDSIVYVDIRKGMYGLPQSGLITNNLLKND